MGLIDCAEYSIEFYSGTWDADFVRRDEKIDYSESADGLTATFADGLQRDAFARQIRLQNILEKLEEQNEAIIYYDFTDSEGNILKKQIKYRWFGKEKTEILAVQEDITKAYAQERQRVAQLQEALKRANSASFAKTEFLSRMSHDMRTPLNGILGMSYLAENETDPAVIRDYISKIEASAKFQLGLINDILDMTRVESGKIELHPEPYTIAEFTAYINAVIVPLCEERRQQFIFEPVNMVNDIVPLVDKQHMNQIVFNLLSNAVKYTPEGGTITYQAEERKLSDSRMAIHIDVMDNGIGMSSEFQEVLFEPFTQENRDDVSEMLGSGLGLSIVKKLIEAMGGNISVKSRPGAGTTFSLDLISDCVPADEAVKDAARPDEPEKEGMLTGRHILLCEDHPLNQEIAKGILEGKGAIVSVADNGKLGIDIFENSTIGYFDCILMDIHMPEMNGYETAKMIRRLMRPDAENVPIIAMTADAFEEDVQKCLDAGMNGHVAKPIVPDLLYKALASSFLKKQGTGN
jgi:signal transduction histidine kinase